MSNNNSSFAIKLQAMLDKVKSIANLKAAIKSIEQKLSKIKIQSTLDSATTQKNLNTTLKTIKPKVKVDTDTSTAVKTIQKLEQQKTNTTITPVVDNSQVVSSLKTSQKETKTLFDKFLNGAVSANLTRMSIQKVTEAIYQAIQGVKELDTIKTKIQMTSGATDSEVNAIISSYNSIAKGLSSTTRAVAETAYEFLYMGESAANTNELIKNTQMLAKIGMLDSSDAASYLVSSMKGYQIAAKDSVDIVNKLTAVDTEAAVSAGGLAEALSICSNIANSSGTSMDRLIGYTAAVGEVTQKSMSEVGNSFQSIYSRMSNIKIGHFVDDETGESLSDTETVLNNFGIQLRDAADTYRNFDDILDDVSSRWNTFTQVEQNAISVAIAGTKQCENFVALMNNYASALEYSEAATNSAGSALERYEVYQNSIEAKTNELTAAIESLSTNIISEDLYSGIIKATAGIVEFLDKTNLLKGTLAGLVTMGVSKLFVSIGSNIITVAKSTSQLGTVMALLGKERTENNLKKVGEACVGLNDKQLKLVLSSKGLSYEHQKQILENKDVAESQIKSTLTTLGFAQAENVATGSTFRFSNAMKGLGASIKSLASTHPGLLTIIASIGAIAAAIIDTIIVSIKEQEKAFDDARNKCEQSQKKLNELNNEMQTTQSHIDELQAKADNGTITLIEEDELKRLKQANAELERQIKDMEIINSQNNQNAAEEAVKTYHRKNNAADSETIYNASFYGEKFQTGAFLTDAGDNLSAYDYAISETEKKIQDYEKKVQELNNRFSVAADDYDRQLIQNDLDYNQQILNNLTASNEMLSQRASEVAKRIFSDKTAEYNEYKETLSQSMNSDGTFEDELLQSAWNSITEKQKNLYKYIGYSGEWNKIQLDNMLNGNLDDIFSEIKDMKQDNNSLITEEDVQNCSALYEYLNNTDLILDCGKNAAQVLAQYLNESCNASQKLADLTSQFVDPSNLLKESDDKTKTATLADLQSEADLLTAIQKELNENGKISVSSMQSIIKQYPEAKETLADYMSGLMTEQELFSQLEQCYEDDTDQYIKNLISKSAADDSFWNAVYTGNVQLQNTIAAIYGDDFKGFQNLAQAKKQINDDLIHKLVGDWAEYNSIIYKNADGLWEIYDRDALEQEALQAYNGDESGSYAASEYAAAAERLYGSDQKMKDRMEQLKAWLNETNTAQNAIDNAAYESIRSSYDFSWKNADGDGESASTSASAAAQSYDLIERAAESLEKKISSLKNITDDTFSTWSERNTALADQINAVTEKIHLQEQACGKYMALADSAGLDDYYKDLIINGDIDIISIADEHLQEQINTFQSCYDKAAACDEAIQGLQGDLNELSKTKFNNISAQFRRNNRQCFPRSQYARQLH